MMRTANDRTYLSLIAAHLADLAGLLGDYSGGLGDARLCKIGDFLYIFFALLTLAFLDLDFGNNCGVSSSFLSPYLGIFELMTLLALAFLLLLGVFDRGGILLAMLSLAFFDGDDLLDGFICVSSSFDIVSGLVVGLGRLASFATAGFAHIIALDLGSDEHGLVLVVFGSLLYFFGALLLALALTAGGLFGNFGGKAISVGIVLVTISSNLGGVTIDVALTLSLWSKGMQNDDKNEEKK